MVGSAFLSWVLTLAFVVTGTYYARQLVRPTSGIPLTRADKVSAVAHLIMSVGMIPMLWWWGMDLPALPQILLYGAASMWFLWLAVTRAPEPCCSLFGNRRTYLYHLHHFLLMAGMVWMVVSMSHMAGPPASAEISMAGMDHGAPMVGMDHGSPMVGMDHGAPMVGMDHGAPMVGMDHGSPMAGHDSGSHAAHDTGSPVGTVVTASFAGYLLLLVPWWLFEMIRAGRVRLRMPRWLQLSGEASSADTKPAPVSTRAKRRRSPRRMRQRAAVLQAGIHALKCGAMGVMLLATM